MSTTARSCPRPRYLMEWAPEDWMRRGPRVDMFDCVMPTRNGRNGHYFTSPAWSVRNAKVERTCARSRGLRPGLRRRLQPCLPRQLDAATDNGPILGTLHNLWYYQR